MFEQLDGLLLLFQRAIEGIFDAEFCGVDEVEHKVVVEVFSQKLVFFLNVGREFFAVAERLVVSKREIVGHNLFASVLEASLEFFERRNANGVISVFRFLLQKRLDCLEKFLPCGENVA